MCALYYDGHGRRLIVPPSRPDTDYKSSDALILEIKNEKTVFLSEI